MDFYIFVISYIICYLCLAKSNDWIDSFISAFILPFFLSGLSLIIGFIFNGFVIPECFVGIGFIAAPFTIYLLLDFIVSKIL